MCGWIEAVATFLLLSGNYVSDHSHCLHRLLTEDRRRELVGVLQDDDQDSVAGGRLAEVVGHRTQQLLQTTRRSKCRLFFTKLGYFLYMTVCLATPVSYMVYSNTFIPHYSNVGRLTMNAAGVLAVLAQTLGVYLDMRSSVPHLLEMVLSLPSIAHVRRLVRRAFLLQMGTLLVLLVIRIFSLYVDTTNWHEMQLGQFVIHQVLFGLYIQFVFSCLYPIAFLLIVPECVSQHLATLHKDHCQNVTMSENPGGVGPPQFEDIFQDAIIREKVHNIRWLYSKLSSVRNSVVSIAYFTNFTAIMFAVSVTEYLGQYVFQSGPILPTMRFVKGLGLAVTIVLFLWPALKMRRVKTEIMKYQNNFIRRLVMQNCMKDEYEGPEKQFVQRVTAASRGQITALAQYLEWLFEAEQFEFDTKVPVMKIWPYTSVIFIPILLQIIHSTGA